jgi:hypothetical protein
MSIQQGNNIITNQLAANHDGISNRPVSDNFSSSRSYAPECKFNHFSIFFFEKELFSNHICFIINEEAGEAFKRHRALRAQSSLILTCMRSSFLVFF